MYVCVCEHDCRGQNPWSGSFRQWKPDPARTGRAFTCRALYLWPISLILVSVFLLLLLYWRQVYLCTWPQPLRDVITGLCPASMPCLFLNHILVSSHCIYAVDFNQRYVLGFML